MILLLVLIIIIVCALFVKYQRDNDIKNFQLVAQKLNGKVEFGSKGFKKFLAVIFPPDIIFSLRYSDMDFTITVNDLNADYAVGRYFTVEAKSNSKLLSFTIFRKMSFFMLSTKDVPISEYNRKGVKVYARFKGRCDEGKEIIINGKKHCFYSNNKDEVLEIIKQSDVIKQLQFLLLRFRSIDIANDKVKMVKIWSSKDSIPDNFIELLNDIAFLAQSVSVK